MLQGAGTDPAAVQQIRQGLQSKKAFTVTLLNYKKGGSPFQNCLHIAPIRDAAGEVKFFCGVQVELGSRPGTGGRRVSAGEGAMLSLNGGGGGETDGNSAAGVEEMLEPTGMQVLQQKGVVGAVRVAARSLSTQGLRRAQPDQHNPANDPAHK